MMDNETHLKCIKGTLSYLPKIAPKLFDRQLDIWINGHLVVLQYPQLWALRECIDQVLAGDKDRADCLSLFANGESSVFEVAQRTRFMLLLVYVLRFNQSGWLMARQVVVNATALRALLATLDQLLALPGESRAAAPVHDPWTPFINSLEEL